MNIGVDIGGSHIGVGIIKNGEVIDKIEKNLRKEDKENIINFIEENIINLSIELQNKKVEETVNIGMKNKPVQEVENVKIQNKNVEEIESIGIAIPGTVKKETIVKCVNLKIENYNIVDELSKKIKQNPEIKVSKTLKIRLVNDAKAAAIAENKYGVIKDFKSSVFLTLGTGIGGAVFYDNKLLKTGNYPGFEFGHMTINCESKEKCKCGKYGCFEQYGSMRVFKENLKKELNLKDDITGEELYNIVKGNLTNNKNLEETNKIIDDFAKYLSIGFSNLVNIFEPDIIGIGGSFVYFEKFVLERIENYIKNENLLFNKRDDIIIKSAILGNDAGMIGASIVAEE